MRDLSNLSGRWLLIILLGLSGCAHTVTSERPQATQQHWEAPRLTTQDSPLPLTEPWWQTLNAPVLNQLIEQALAANPDVQSAWLSLSRAQINLQGVQSDRLPLNVTAGAQTQASSHSNTSGIQRQESAQLGLNASYEIDLWGRVAALETAGEASFQASYFDWQAAQLSLSISVAETWFQWLALNAQHTSATAHLQRSLQQLQLLEARAAAGSVTPADLSRQRSSVISQQNSLDNLVQQKHQTRRALALLLGQSAYAWQPPEADLNTFYLPSPDPGLPTELISRRPDLASQEARLVAAEANLVQARAALYPSLSLQTSASLASDSLSFSDPTRSLNLTASLLQTLFDRGSRQRQIAMTDLQRLELLESYRKALLSALVEVENALDRLHYANQTEQRQLELVRVQQQLLDQTLSHYRHGSETLSNLLDAQTSLAQAQDQQIQLRVAHLQAGLDLYKALGGGFTFER